MPGTIDNASRARRAGSVSAAVNRLRTRRLRFAGPLFVAAGVSAVLATGACSENRPFERESAGAQTRLAVPTSMTPPISVRGIDGAPSEWKLSERVAEALRSRDIPASSALRSRSSYVLKGEMRQGVERNGRSRVEVVWSLYDGVGKKVGEVTQMAAVPGTAFKAPNEGVIEAMADAAAESIAPLVPSSSVQLADGTETGERRANERAKIEDRDRVTAVGKMKSESGVAKNLLEPPKPVAKADVKVDGGSPSAKTARSAATPPASARTTPPATAATGGDKKAITAVGRYEGASTLSRNLLRPDIDPSKPLPVPRRAAATEVPRQTASRDPGDAEESLGAGPVPASEGGRRIADPAPLHRTPADPPRRTQAPQLPQIAEIPAPRREVVLPRPQVQPAPRVEPPEQYAERAARTGYQYWIQVGANKDEAASRAQLEKLQGASQGLFANVGNRIQRADLGARGVYYRIQLGPFASAGEAGQFCAQLKTRQIDCFLAAPEATTAATQPTTPAARPAAPPPQRKAAPAPKPVAKPAESPPAPKADPPKPTETAAPKKPEPEAPTPLPEPKPRDSAEKPDAPISTAPGLPGVLD